MEQPKAMEYGSRKASPDVLKPHTYMYFITSWPPTCCSHSCGGKSKNTNVLIMCQDHSTDKNQRVLVRILVKC